MDWSRTNSATVSPAVATSLRYVRFTPSALRNAAAAARQCYLLAELLLYRNGLPVTTSSGTPPVVTLPGGVNTTDPSLAADSDPYTWICEALHVPVVLDFGAVVE
eukprot:1361972-Pyramimonas_sp.AAC.1